MREAIGQKNVKGPLYPFPIQMCFFLTFLKKYAIIPSSYQARLYPKHRAF